MLRVNIREKRIFISSENLVLLFLEIFLPGNKIMFRREDKCTQVNKLEKLECNRKWPKMCNAIFYAAKDYLGGRFRWKS